MPRGYWQCLRCLRPMSTKYKAGNRPQIVCRCAEVGTTATFRGDGLEGRRHWPHGQSAGIAPERDQVPKGVLDPAVITEELNDWPEGLR